MKYSIRTAMFGITAALLLAGCPEVHGSFDLEDQSQDHGAKVVVRGKPVVIPAGKVAPGDIVVVEGKAEVDGHVKGDLVVIAGELEVGPKARIDGELVGIGNTRTEIAETAQIKGERVFVNWTGAKWFVDTGLFVLENPVAVGVTACVGFLLLLGLAWLLIIRPYDTERFHHTVANHPVRAGLLGLLIAVGIHVLMVLAFFSRYGIGLVPVLALVNFALAGLGWIVVGGHVGRWMARRYDWRVGPFWYGLAGVGILAGSIIIPLVGSLAWMLASWVGVGALLAPVKIPEGFTGTGPAAEPTATAPTDSSPDVNQSPAAPAQLGSELPTGA